MCFLIPMLSIFCSFLSFQTLALLESKQDVEKVLKALNSTNNLPIFLKEAREEKVYNAIHFVERTLDYEVGVVDLIDLKSLQNLYTDLKSKPQQLDSLRVTTLGKQDIKTYFKLSWDGGEGRIVLIRKPFDAAYFENKAKKYYYSADSDALWVIQAAEAWARNIHSPHYFKNDPKSPVDPLWGSGIIVGFWDLGLCHTHEFGGRYLGGYDYMNDKLLGPGGKDPQRFSPIWNDEVQLHGHYLSHLACGPCGVAPETSVHFDVVMAEQVKQKLVNRDGSSIDAVLDTAHAGNIGSKHFERTQERDAFAREVIQRGTNILSLSYGTESSPVYPLGGPLRQLLKEQNFLPHAETLGILTDHNIAITINAGNNMDQKGPQHPAALASDFDCYGGRILAVGAYSNEEKHNKSNWATESVSMQKRFIVAPSKGHTSNAAPIAAGALALIMSMGNLTAAQAVDVLVETALPLEPRKKYGSGLINLDRATQRVMDILRDDSGLSKRLNQSLETKLYPLPDFNFVSAGTPSAAISSILPSSTTSNTASLTGVQDFMPLLKVLCIHGNTVDLGGVTYAITYIANKPFFRALEAFFPDGQDREMKLKQALDQKKICIEDCEGPAGTERYQRVTLIEGDLQLSLIMKFRKKV